MSEGISKLRWWDRRIPAFRSFSPELGDAIGTNLAVQFILVLFTSLNLDGGATFQIVAMPCVAYWLIVLVILVRRAKNPTLGDRILLRAGFVIALLIIPWTHPSWGWLRELLK